MLFRSHVTAYPKSGAIGVLVRIVLPGTEFPDKAKGAKIELPKIIAQAEDVTAATPMEVAPKEAPAPLRKRRPMRAPPRRK